LDGLLADGDTVTMGDAAWQAIGVPGHAASSVAFHDPARGLLLSGDILVSIGAANVTLHRVGDGRLPAGWQLTINASLDRLARLPLRRVYPGHGQPIDDPATTLADRLRRTQARLDQVLGLLRDGPRTAYEVAQALYQPPVGTSSLGLSQSLGYLDALEALGQVVGDEHAGIRRYGVDSGQLAVDSA
jgi:glyoxylase-like metal-dependent hydrolase (beta-lactamase superfamily II)